jgi:uncharacterized membrane protein YhhN
MPGRALAERRPWLFASLAVAISYWFFRESAIPGIYLLVWKGAAAGLLAAYALLHHPSNHARMLSGFLALCAIGDMLFEVDRLGAIVAFALAHLLAILLFADHRRAAVSPSQKALAAALLLAVPLLAWLLPADRSQAPYTAAYGLVLAAMAAMAWTSSFPRYRVGLGALLFVASDLLILARSGPLAGESWVERLIWPVYYAGVFLICIGVIQTLRRAGEFESE